MPSIKNLRRFFHRWSKSPDVNAANLPNNSTGSSPGLCPSCRTIELPPRSLHRNATSHRIGTVAEVFENKNRCPFCRMISLTFAHLNLTKGEGHVFVKVASIQQAFTLHIGTRTVPYMEIGYHTPEDATAMDAPFPTDRIHHFIRGTMFKGETVRQWLQECESEHPSNCNAVSWRHHEQNIPILLLDTLEMKIVEAHTGFRYLALSYVWGGTPTLRLSKQNRAAFSQPASITRAWIGVPRVMQDSIQITQQLEERYLWVDSLCIPQDDEDFKSTQISQMNSIYSQAALTLVAMAAESADQPLLLQDDTTHAASELARELEQIENAFAIKIVSFQRENTAGALAGQLFRSVHESRAWTYQERLLSRRCLFIGKSGVFLDCPSYLQTSFGMKITQSNTQSVNGIWRLPSRKLMDVELSAQVSGADEDLVQRDFGEYQMLVARYSSKNLTYPSDVYRAFSGILASLHCLQSDIPKPGFVCGLPRKFLELALYWRPSEDLKPRQPFLPRTDASILATPSWSWGSWVGAVSYDSAAAPYFSHSTIRWIALTKDRSRWTSETSTPDADADASKSNFSFDWVHESASTELNWTGACTIHFWADTVRLSNFRFQPFLTLPDDTPLEEPITSIIDARGRHCGFVYVEESSLRSWYSSDMHAILLFRGQWSGYETLESVDSRFSTVKFDSFSYETMTKDREGHRAMYIMLVSEDLGVAERVSVGKIHFDSWQEAGPERRIISLA